MTQQVCAALKILADGQRLVCNQARDHPGPHGIVLIEGADPYVWWHDDEQEEQEEQEDKDATRVDRRS